MLSVSGLQEEEEKRRGGGGKTGGALEPRNEGARSPCNKKAKRRRMDGGVRSKGMAMCK